MTDTRRTDAPALAFTVPAVRGLVLQADEAAHAEGYRAGYATGYAEGREDGERIARASDDAFAEQVARWVVAQLATAEQLGNPLVRDVSRVLNRMREEAR